MIIGQTPMRVSFFGGGTDFPEYFLRHGGAVLGTAIDKFAYLSVSRLYSRLFDYSIRVAYRQVECVKTLDDLEHAPFRECLRWCGISRDVEVNYAAELPSFSGLGTSSSFVVGLLQALHAFTGKQVAGLELAREAIELEREVLKEAVGWQDQTLAAIGGLNVVEFRMNGEIAVEPIRLSAERQRELEAHLLVLFTGQQRRANDYSARLLQRMAENEPALRRMRQLVDAGHSALAGNASLERFGALLDESWQLKSDLEASIASDHIRWMYQQAREAGAFGGKLLGAGGGGFLLFVVPPERRQAVRERLPCQQELELTIAAPGSRIVHP
jgi:D-glycero-alpha-D-manno-heptose-7-phosphate kinase